jgi:ribosomal protein S18 acetylase RimI-like enzyme
MPESRFPALRFATRADAAAMAALHTERIAEGFLVTLGPAFLERLYGRIAVSSHAFALVADVRDERLRGEGPSVGGFVAVAESTHSLYREFVLHDGLFAGLAAARGIVRAPRAVWETLRYGLRGGATPGTAEILATAVAAERSGQGIATALVREAVDELRRRGIGAAHVVTAAGNDAAVRAYEHGGFRADGHRVVHRGVAQQLLVWP